MLLEKDKPYWSYINHGVYWGVHGAYCGGQMPNYEKLCRLDLNGCIEWNTPLITSSTFVQHNISSHLHQR